MNLIEYFRNLIWGDNTGGSSLAAPFLGAALALCLLLSGGAAYATTPVNPDVPEIDYANAAGVVLTSVGGTVTLLFPYLAALVALFAGISIFRRMVKSGAKG